MHQHRKRKNRLHQFSKAKYCILIIINKVRKYRQKYLTKTSLFGRFRRFWHLIKCCFRLVDLSVYFITHYLFAPVSLHIYKGHKFFSTYITIKSFTLIYDILFLQPKHGDSIIIYGLTKISKIPSDSYQQN